MEDEYPAELQYQQTNQLEELIEQDRTNAFRILIRVKDQINHSLNYYNVFNADKEVNKAIELLESIRFLQEQYNCDNSHTK